MLLLAGGRSGKQSEDVSVRRVPEEVTARQ